MTEKLTFDERMTICESCDRYRFIMCTECGCVMHIKARIPIFDCPLKKWNHKQLNTVRSKQI